MKISKTLLCVLLLGASASAWADPPLQVLYSNSKTTHFKWHWPSETVTTYSAVQTKPYYRTGRRLSLVTKEDVSKYRYYYRQNTCKNKWGYFFPAGTKLCYHKPYPIFEAPSGYYQEFLVK